jgi:selenocysteine-specific elongation factor
VELVPGGRRVRIRGLQQHSRPVEVASPGSRVAANITGAERNEIRRGDVLARPGTLPATRRVDVRVRVLADSPRPLRHGAELTLHTGTVEVGCRAIVLEGDAIDADSEGWVQLYLEAPIAAASGDRFILRLPSPSTTLAGGRFADVAPRKHPRHDAAVRQSLERRASGDVLQEELRKYPRGVAVAALLKATLATGGGVDGLAARRVAEWIWAPEHWDALKARAREELHAYHGAHPLRVGMPREELRSRLGVAQGAFAPALAGLIEDGLVAEREGEISLPEHQVASEAADGAGSRLLEELGRNPFAPPSIAEAMEKSGAGAEVVRALERKGDLVRLSEDVAFTRNAYEGAVSLVTEMIASSGSVTVAQLRDRMGASRRPALALLEHLDSRRVTRRVGDARVLR